MRPDSARDPAEALDVLLRWLAPHPTDPGQWVRQPQARTAAVFLADHQRTVHGMRPHGGDIAANWKTLITGTMHQLDVECCDACIELDTLCPYHQGIQQGAALMVQALTAVSRDSTLMADALRAGPPPNGDPALVRAAQGLVNDGDLMNDAITHDAAAS